MKGCGKMNQGKAKTYSDILNQKLVRILETELNKRKKI